METSDKRIALARILFPDERVVWDGSVGKGVLKINLKRVRSCTDRQTLDEFKDSLRIARPEVAKMMEDLEANEG